MFLDLIFHFLLFRFKFDTHRQDFEKKRIHKYLEI